MRSIPGSGLLVAVAGLALTAGSAYASTACWQDHEVTAAKVRNLQSMLMVAALQCTGPTFRTNEHYDHFVRQNRSALVGHNDALKSYFMRAYGVRDGQRAYDAFTTALANSHSDYAVSTGASFCYTADSLVRLAATSNGEDLLILASNVSERPLGVGSYCREGAPTLAGLAPPAPPEPQIAVAAAFPPAPIAAPSVVDTPPVEVSPEAAAIEPPPTLAALEEPAAVAQPAVAASEQTATAQALHAAAVALQAAAEALKSASAQPDDAVEAISIDDGEAGTQ